MFREDDLLYYILACCILSAIASQPLPHGTFASALAVAGIGTLSRPVRPVCNTYHYHLTRHLHVSACLYVITVLFVSNPAAAKSLCTASTMAHPYMLGSGSQLGAHCPVATLPLCCLTYCSNKADLEATHKIGVTATIATNPIIKPTSNVDACHVCNMQASLTITSCVLCALCMCLVPYLVVKVQVLPDLVPWYFSICME